MKLAIANALVDAVLAYGDETGLNPLTVTILDARGVCKAMQSQDGSSLLRSQIAHGKAYGAIGLGIGSRAVFERAQQQPYFVDAVNGAANGALIPVPGGLLVKDGEGTLIGAVGVTGDSSDNDEAAAKHAIEQVGMVADTG